MEVIKTEIPGVLIVEPTVYGDERGYFFESFKFYIMNLMGLSLFK